VDTSSKQREGRSSALGTHTRDDMLGKLRRIPPQRLTDESYRSLLLRCGDAGGAHRSKGLPALDAPLIRNHDDATVGAEGPVVSDGF
jgi:hypothetical protein